MSDNPEDARAEETAGDNPAEEGAEVSAGQESAEQEIAAEVDAETADGSDSVAEAEEGAGEEAVGEAVDVPEEVVSEDAEEESAAEEPVGEESAEGESAEDEAAEEEAAEEEAAPAAVAAPRSGPLELIEEPEVDIEAEKDWYILKVSVNREPTIAAALQRRVKMEGLEHYFGEIIVPTEEQTEFTKAGKKRKVKKKLYPGYIVVNMAINDETWFLVRETSGIGDFTGAAGKPAPLQKHEIDRILNISHPKPDAEGGETHVISHKIGDRVRVNEGYFQNFEGVVDSIDLNSGRVTVLITIFNRTAPVELEHWHIEAV